MKLRIVSEISCAALVSLLSHMSRPENSEGGRYAKAHGPAQAEYQQGLLDSELKKFNRSVKKRIEDNNVIQELRRVLEHEQPND